MRTRRRSSVKINKIICKHEGCKSESKNQGYCNKHYWKMEQVKYIKYDVDYDNENVLFVNEFKNNINTYVDCFEYIKLIIYNKIKKYFFVAEISKDKLEMVKKYVWGVQSNSYISCKTNRKSLLLHRYIKDIHSSDFVDHINRDKMDNENLNLRVVCPSESGVNKSIQSNNTSGITGVIWDKSREKWKVVLNIYNVCYNLGRYDSFDDAVGVRLEAEKKYHKEFTPIERQQH